MKMEIAGIGLAGSKSAQLEALRTQLAALNLPSQFGDPSKAPGQFLGARVRRRASRFTRWVADAYGHAVEMAGVDPARSAIILSSDLGEIEVTGEILQAIAGGETRFSPTRFHNSVHNTATGYLSIETRNQAGSTAISAGDAGLAAAWVEAAGQLAMADHVVLIVAEEGMPSSLMPSEQDAEQAHFAQGEGMVLAFVLSTPGRSTGRHWPVDFELGDNEFTVEIPRPDDQPPPHHLAIEHGLGLVRALLAGRSTAVALAATSGRDWASRCHLLVEPPGHRD